MKHTFIRIELMPVGPLGMAAAEAGGQILGMGLQQVFGNANARKQLRNSKQLMDYQQRLALEMWEKTGYGGQMEQLTKAGLNPALLYGMGGAGGQTTGNPSASAPLQQTPTGMGIGIGQTIMQAKLTEAQIKNIEADTNKKNVEAGKTGGVDTEEAKARIENLAQTTDNMREEWQIKRLQQKLMHIDAFEKQASQEDRLKQIELGAQQAAQQLKILSADAEVKQETKDELIKLTQLQIAESLVRMRAQESGIQLNKEQMNKMAQDIQQGWAKLANETRGLAQKDKEIAIKKFEAEIKAAYPGLWNVAGKVITDTERLLNKAFNEQTIPTIK